jgi:hypothetical protein
MKPSASTAAAGLATMAMSETMNNKLTTPAEIQWGTGPVILPAVQAAEGLSRPAAYAFKGRTLHCDLGDLLYRDG